jgi:hypothetical protein
MAALTTIEEFGCQERTSRNGADHHNIIDMFSKTNMKAIHLIQSIPQGTI